jgi:CheY-like chemotaxis protein
MWRASNAAGAGGATGAAKFLSGKRILGPKKLKVLIVEDEPLLALDIQRLLQRLRYDVAAVARGQREALLLAHVHDPDLALVDIVLAEGCGVAAARAMLEELGIPSIFMTSYGDYETREWAETADPLAFLPKPVSESQLLRTLRGASLI